MNYTLEVHAGLETMTTSPSSAQVLMSSPLSNSKCAALRKYISSWSLRSWPFLGKISQAIPEIAF